MINRPGTALRGEISMSKNPKTNRKNIFFGNVSRKLRPLR